MIFISAYGQSTESDISWRKSFERFYRCKRDDGGINGSGLGLAIVNELCHALKEKVWAESKLGNGTTIKFTISRK